MRILAIDLGTSSVKLMRMDEHAQVLSTDRVPMCGLTVARWISTLRQNLAEHGDQREICGIAITGQMHGLMTRATDGAWDEGIPWNDTGSAELIAALRDAVGPNAVAVTGGPLAAGFQAASLAWVRTHDRERWARIASVHLPKDALIHELTGEHVTDPSDAAGTGLYAPGERDWSWPIVDGLGIPRDWLPRLMPSGSIAGGLRPEYAAQLDLPRGLPIILAGGDAPAGAYGADVTRGSDALIMLSTGAQVIRPSPVWSPDPEGRWYTWPSVTPKGSDYAPYLRVGTLLNAGNVMSWVESVLVGGNIGEEPTGLIALPRLMGTRERPSDRGAIVGLTMRMTGSDIRRALAEGVAFSIRAKLEEMSDDDGQPTRIRLGGGLAHRADVRQIFADVLGTPVEAVAQPELTAYGAALLALHNLTGLLPDEAIETGVIATPRERAVRGYHAHYALYRAVEEAISPLRERIAALEEEPS